VFKSDAILSTLISLVIPGTMTELLKIIMSQSTAVHNEHHQQHSSPLLI